VLAGNHLGLPLLLTGALPGNLFNELVSELAASLLNRADVRMCVGAAFGRSRAERVVADRNAFWCQYLVRPEELICRSIKAARVRGVPCRRYTADSMVASDGKFVPNEIKCRPTEMLVPDAIALQVMRSMLRPGA
jgi:hypothetical protein